MTKSKTVLDSLTVY